MARRAWRGSDRRGKARRGRRGEVWSDAAGSGWAVCGMAGAARAARQGQARMGSARQARLGLVWRGTARRVRLGCAWRARTGQARRGPARRGVAGMARHGTARCGSDRYDTAGMEREESVVEIIAELSANHLGSLDRALALVDAAAKAGANAVKTQLDPPDGGLTIDCDRPEFRIKGGPWNGRKMIDLYRETWTPWEWTDTIATYAKMRGVAWLSTPGSVEAVEFLEAHGCPRYKVGSFDITDVELLQAIKATGKPVLVSTGCAKDYDLLTVRAHLAPWLTFLHCVSQYPTPVEHADLVAIREYHTYYGWVDIGLSDHSPGSLVPVMAVALGATVIEKHLTLSRADGGPDAAFSMEPDEFAEMVRMVRLAEQAMEPRDTHPARQFVKSLYVVADIAVGERFTRENVRAIRPGHGMHPVELPNILGKQATRSIKRGEPLDASMVAPYGVIV